MSPQKNKKLEAAIDNLFSSPRTRAVTSPKKNFQLNEASAQPEVEKEVVTPVQDSQIDPPQLSPLPIAEVVVEETVIPTPILADTSIEVPAAPLPAVPSTPPPLPAPPVQVIEGSVQMVIFTLEGQYYGIKIEAVDSIIKMQAITELPHAPHYIVGLTNLRGKVLPVISLRRRFDFVDQEPTKDSRIIVISVDQKEAGLIVDGVSEVETILNQNIEPTPEMMESSNSRPIDGIAKLTDRLIILLNLSKLISPGTQSGSFI